MPSSTSQDTSPTSSSDSSTGLGSVRDIVGGKYVHFKRHKEILLDITIGRRVYLVVPTIVHNCLAMLISSFHLQFT